jgi:hypothetical protein
VLPDQHRFTLRSRAAVARAAQVVRNLTVR